MLKDTVFIVGFIPICIICEILSFIKTRKIHSVEFWILRLSLYVYIILLVKVTLFPIPIYKLDLEILQSDNPNGMGNNFIPLHSIVHTINSGVPLKIKMFQLLGNLILLSPFLAYLGLFREKMRKLLNILFVSTIVSLSIEALQFLIGHIVGYNYRSIDIDDVLLNIVGGLIGFVLCQMFIKMFPKLVKEINK